MVPLKYLSKFWRTLNFGKINLILTWSENCVLSDTNVNQVFAIADTKLYVPIVTL